MPPCDKQMYLRFIADLLDELDQEDGLGRGSQAMVALDQQSMGHLSRMEALQAQAVAGAAQTRRDSLRTQPAGCA